VSRTVRVAACFRGEARWCSGAGQVLCSRSGVEEVCSERDMDKAAGAVLEIVLEAVA